MPNQNMASPNKLLYRIVSRYIVQFIYRLLIAQGCMFSETSIVGISVGLTNSVNVGSVGKAGIIETFEVELGAFVVDNFEGFLFLPLNRSTRVPFDGTPVVDVQVGIAEESDDVTLAYGGDEVAVGYIDADEVVSDSA